MDENFDKGAFKVWAVDNMVYGPVGLNTLVHWVRQERVLPDTWIHCQADNLWRRACELEVLQPHFRPAKPAQPAEPKVATVKHVPPDELRQFDIFAGLTNEQLDQFTHFCEVCKARPNEVILQRGDPGDGMFFVLTGEVRARLIIGLEDRTLAVIRAGEFFGEMALFTHSTRSADIVCVSETRLLRLSAQAFLLLLSEVPALGGPVLLAMTRKLAERIIQANQRFQREVASEFLWR